MKNVLTTCALFVGMCTAGWGQTTITTNMSEHNGSSVLTAVSYSATSPIVTPTLITGSKTASGKDKTLYHGSSTGVSFPVTWKESTSSNEVSDDVYFGYKFTIPIGYTLEITKLEWNIWTSTKLKQYQLEVACGTTTYSTESKAGVEYKKAVLSGSADITSMTALEGDVTVKFKFACGNTSKYVAPQTLQLTGTLTQQATDPSTDKTATVTLNGTALSVGENEAITLPLQALTLVATPTDELATVSYTFDDAEWDGAKACSDLTEGSTNALTATVTAENGDAGTYVQSERQNRCSRDDGSGHFRRSPHCRRPRNFAEQW